MTVPMTARISINKNSRPLEEGCANDKEKDKDRNGDLGAVSGDKERQRHLGSCQVE
jgi:hypothetical protein